MPDYKEMYFKMVRATEKATDRLIAAQQECEEMYISSPEPELKIVCVQTTADGKDPSAR